MSALMLILTLFAIVTIWKQSKCPVTDKEYMIHTHNRILFPVFLPGEFHGQRSLVGYISPWGRKELDMTK